jgi:hypothetical protein
MAVSQWQRLLLVAAAAQLGLAGCATPARLPAVPVSQIPQTGAALGPVRFLVSRESDSFATEAQSALSKEQQWLISQGRRGGELPPAYFLAISGGGDDGAFGAGILSGWSAAGTRPQFKAVTGISTGALIAPFAFLGPKYDYVLQRVYTTTGPKDIFKKRGIVEGILGDAMADTRPLAGIIASYVTRSLLDEIAAEYAKGRMLLVGTTNLDTLEPVVWNMTAIAASKKADAVPLFRSVLLASAAMPGAFPPVMIDVNVDGKRYAEMHVDGGTASQVFFYPPSMSLAGAPPRKRALYVIRNARIDADWLSVERRTLSIATRAIASLTRTQGIGDLYRIYSTTQRDGIDFNLAFIPPTFNELHREQFDTGYMRALFEVGRSMATNGFPWAKLPPGYDAPVHSAAAQ